MGDRLPLTDLSRLNEPTDRPTYDVLRFFVGGTAITQGSKRPIRTPQGKMLVVESGGERLKFWRQRMASEAQAAMGGRAPYDGPVQVEAAFWLQKPASAPKRKRTWPIGRRSGDASKYLRALEDSLSGTAIIDDCQIVRAFVAKDWANGGQPPGVAITVRAVL